MLGFTLFLNSIVKPYTGQHVARTIQAPAGIEKEAERARYVAAIQRQCRANEWIEKRTNLVTLASIPLTALVFWLFYRRLNYAEHLVAQVMLAGFYMLVAALLLPLALAPSLRLFATWWEPTFVQTVYITWAFGQFIGGNRPARFVGSGLAALVSILVWTAFSGGLIFLYIRFG